jgi:hypothetical protein
MRKTKTLKTLTIILSSVVAVCVFSCNSGDEKKVEASGEKVAMSKDEMIKRGDYLVNSGACQDCHSPKQFGLFGEPFPDSIGLLSGHPASGQNPPLDANAGKPGNWIYMAPDITSFVGPWGISYAANLTPDSATGIGAWNEDNFIQTLRTGKHLGNGRDILPPMPWPSIGKMTDDDLKSVFAYLKSLPAVSNRVPAPVSPPELEAMKMKK